MKPCDRCGQSASLRLVQGGVERWACSACADAISGGTGLFKLAESLCRSRHRVSRCPHCGCTEEAAKKTGLVGCPLCYVAFESAFFRDMGIPMWRWTRADAS